MAERLEKAYSPKETGLYDRLGELFVAMDKGDPSSTCRPTTAACSTRLPTTSDRREQRIARFLKSTRSPTATSPWRSTGSPGTRTSGRSASVFIDYKSLEVRHLGSIYEGLLEFKLKVAEEDLTTQADKKGRRQYIPLSQAKAKRGRQAEVVVRKGEVYLSNDKAERKASGSYYTPDPIVEYIVAHTVGPVLEEKLEALRPEFRKVRKTFDRYDRQREGPSVPRRRPQERGIDRRQLAGEKTYNTHKDLVERLFDLKVLDPAMGSGHFLVEAVDFITDRLLKFLNGSRSTR